MNACPICRSRPATSPHHILPRAAGGTDEPINIVMLCGRCHDIIEFIYGSTGVQYSPALVRASQIEMGVAPTRVTVCGGGVVHDVERNERQHVSKWIPIYAKRAADEELRVRSMFRNETVPGRFIYNLSDGHQYYIKRGHLVGV